MINRSRMLHSQLARRAPMNPQQGQYHYRLYGPMCPTQHHSVATFRNLGLDASPLPC
jgi:hypothetical protein